MRRWWSLGRTELCSLAGLAGAALGSVLGSALGWKDVALVPCVIGAALVSVGSWTATRGRPEQRPQSVPAVVLLVAIPVVGLVYLVGLMLGVTRGSTAAGFTLFMSGIVLAQIIGRMVTDLIEGRSGEAATDARRS
jgi:hypothetical protein